MILDLGFDSEIACGAALVLAGGVHRRHRGVGGAFNSRPGQINPAKTAAETSMISMPTRPY
jgi:hypothetical protein